MSRSASTLKRDIAAYGVGYILAISLTMLAFGIVRFHWLSPSLGFGVILGLALAQIVVHFRCFLHVDLKRSSREDLQLILFSTLVICLMVGGTLVILFNLRMRMM